MKQKSSAVSVAVTTILIVATLFSCSGKVKSDRQKLRRPVKEAVKPTQKTGDYSDSRAVVLPGKGAYTVAVTRKADESLALADDGRGNKYYDNIITVVITSDKGKEVYRRVFTKKDFASYIESEYYNNSAMLGVVFDAVRDGYFYFAASVGSPDIMSDEYVPFVVRVSPQGWNDVVYKDTQLDIGSLSDYDDDV